jgi:phosphatidylserine/phosphatidylglycerophosphate/cardiolipin synthase-like enzyme
VQLIVQPADGVQPLIDAVESATASIDIVIFRFDLKRLEKALEAAVDRGVAVRALIAHTNSGGGRRLRQLELRMLERGVTVSRTADDLVRYHGKLMLLDRQALHLFGFNYTAPDLRSRSFGVVARDKRIVQEAMRLFEADAQRQTYEPSSDALVVSPENAREQLATFIKRARKQLLIWDPKLTDPQMIRLLRERAKAGVDLRLLGKAAKRAADLPSRKFPGRLHVRAIIRDADAAFVGSQSLRALELDGRREVGLVAKESRVVKRLVELFEADWQAADNGKKHGAAAAAVEEAEEAVS